MADRTYNYSVFDVSPNEFINFATRAPKVTMRALSFPLEDGVGQNAVSVQPINAWSAKASTRRVTDWLQAT